MMMKEDKLAYWQGKLEEYQKSGLSRRAFGEQNGVTRSTVNYWFAQVRKERKERELVEVKSETFLSQDPALQIVVGNRYRIELHRGFDPVLLGEVVKVLESIQ